MTPLGAYIRARVEQDGPLSIAEYMRICLQHPEYGYYHKKDPLGARGDFTTAPEISQMFGEMLGLCLAQYWLDTGAPKRITLAELGPGRGTLMADVLRATRVVSGFHDAAQITLIETSPALRKRQAETLAAFAPEWHDTLPTTDTPLFLVANEFFDALPIHQYRRAGDGWHERQISLNNEELCFTYSNAAPIPELAHRLADTKEGDLVETCNDAARHAAAIGTQIARHGGCALLIDYGDWRSQGDTFQAVSQHKVSDPLQNAGMADLTAHVDFEAIALAAAPASPSYLTPQGMFLERLGITARAQALAKGLSGAALKQHIAAHRRLTHPAEMGSLFKVMALFQEGRTPPAGLEHGH